METKVEISVRCIINKLHDEKKVTRVKNLCRISFRFVMGQRRELFARKAEHALTFPCPALDVKYQTNKNTNKN